MNEMKALNELDRGYQFLIDDILTNGVDKDTRAGKVKSLFGKHFRIDLKQGFPLLTTKKVFTKGIIHELLWFLQRPYNNHGSSNIEYLVRNNVHIWDDDAYRWFKEWVNKEIVAESREFNTFIAEGDDESVEGNNTLSFKIWDENERRKNDSNWLLSMNKDEFLDLTLQRAELRVKQDNGETKPYRFGDLGPIYGKQWRMFDGRGYNKVDQIENIINCLKTNPNDRRMLCIAYNPSVLNEVALPPCHVMMQFYTRELSVNERWELYRKRYKDEAVDSQGKNEYIENYKMGINPYKSIGERERLNKILDDDNIPKYGLSCMWTQRSVDVCCGLPFNIASYALLTMMIGMVVNMEPDMLIGSLGDCHIYENHFEGAREQLTRKGADELPTMKINRKVGSLEEFTYDDFKIEDYNPEPPIKYPLNVG